MGFIQGGPPTKIQDLTTENVNFTSNAYGVWGSDLMKW